MYISYKTVRITGVAILLTVVVFISMFSYGIIEKSAEWVKYIINVEEFKLRKWNNFAHLIDRSKDHLIAYTCNQEEMLTPVLLMINKAYKMLGEIEEVTTDVYEADKVNDMKAEIRTFEEATLDYQDKVKKSAVYGGGIGAPRAIEIAEHITDVSRDMVNSMNIQALDENEEILHSIYFSEKVLSTILFFAVLLIGIAVLFMGKILMRPIKQLVEAIRRVAEGDFSKKVDLKSSDEIGVLVDSFNKMVDELKNSRMQLVDKAYVDSIMESMVDALITVDIDGRIKSANKAILDMLGYTMEEIVGKPAQMIFVDEEQEIIDQIEEKVLLISDGFKILKANKAFFEEAKLKRKDVIDQFCYKVLHKLDNVCEPTYTVCPIRKTMELGKPSIERYSQINGIGKESTVNVISAPISDNWGNPIYYIHLLKDVAAEKPLDVSQEEDLLYARRLTDRLKVYVENLEKVTLFTKEGLQRLIRLGSVKDAEMRFISKSGEKIDVVFSGSVLYAPDTARSRPGVKYSKKDVAGFIGVARDMRQIRMLIKDLQEAKIQLTDWSQNLEKKVEERTKELTVAQEATLNMMEDLGEETRKLEESNTELQKAREELETFSRNLEEKVKKRTEELSVLYEISRMISYTLDYQQLFKLVMEALRKIVDYDICAAIILSERTNDITVNTPYLESAGFVDTMKDRLVGFTSSLISEDVDGNNIRIMSVTEKPMETNDAIKESGVLKSFCDVPFVVHGNAMGAISVASCKEDAFSEESIKFIYTIANQTATAIEQLQAVLEAEKSKMSAMVESMTEGIVMIDINGDILVINPKVKKLLGFGREEKIRPDDLKERLSSAGLEKYLQDYVDIKEPVSVEIVSPEDQRRTLNCNITPVRDREGNPIGIAIVLRDITKEKEVDRMKTEFVSTVSHELRTPLTTIREGVSQVLEGILGKTTSMQRDFLSICLEDIDRLKRIIDDLLDISKIEAGKIDFVKDRILIGDLVDRVLESFSAHVHVKKKGLKLKKELPKEGLEIYADQDKIKQVLTNLVGNALKFTEKGYIKVKVVDKEKYIECSVIDTGPGISAENMDMVFGKFQQFGRMPGAGEKGTGLGLAISKSIIEIHKGRMSVESTPGKGSTFSFILPKYNESDIITDLIEEKLKINKDRRKQFCAFTLRIDNWAALERKVGKNQMDTILVKISNAVRDTSGIKGMNIRHSSYRIMSVFDCDEDKRDKMIERIIRRVKETLFNKYKDLDIRFSYGYSVYPVHSEETEELVRKSMYELISEERERFKKCIMIVDDEEDMRTSLKELLTNTGYSNIILANDGEEALKKVDESIPDLVVLDMKMPKISGYEVIGRLTGNIKTRDIPILMMSGYNIERKGLEKYVDDNRIPAMEKPIDPVIFKRWVNYLL